MSNELMSFEDARDTLMAAARVSTSLEQVDTLNAHGRVLAEALVAGLDVPSFDNSAMDGYAVRCADLTESGGALQVTQRIAAGGAGEALAAGSAARIFTGAPVPQGCNAVVMQERTRRDGDTVYVDEVPRPGQNIRRAGEDIARGADVIAAGTRLSAAHLGLAASIGQASLSVRPRLRVAVFFTGDELQMPGETLRPGAIYNSNRFVLRALLEGMGCRCTDLGIVRDSLDETVAALRLAAADHDVVLTCGGVSVGEEDHVKAAVEQLGTLNLWRIAIKPGKPLAWGRIGEADFIGLPGNPVSAYVTFAVLVAPFLRARQGQDVTVPGGQRVPAGFDWPRPDKRREFLRVRLINGEACLHANQGAGVLSSCAWAEGLVELAPMQAVQRGEPVRFVSYAELGVNP